MFPSIAELHTEIFVISLADLENINSYKSGNIRGVLW